MSHQGMPNIYSVSPEATFEGFLFDDEKFYKLVEEITKIFIALGPNGGPLFKAIDDSSLGRVAPTKDAPPDPKLGELENFVFEDLFASDFDFDPLEGPRAIRFLILHPGHESEPLRGTIEHGVVREISNTTKGVSLSRRYEAISYVWGSDAKPCSILLNGCRKPITKSLSSALVRSRNPHHDRVLWADGICINQYNNEEKSVQVALMPEIYTYASKVLIHLGDQGDHSECMPELAGKLRRLEFDRLQKRKLQPGDLVSLGLPPPESHLWTALGAFFTRPWFSRMWTIQEVVFARDAQVFCGDWQMSWKRIADIGNIFEYVIDCTRPELGSQDFQSTRRGATGAALVRGFQLARSIAATRIDRLQTRVDLKSLHLEISTEVDELAADLAAKRDFVVKACVDHPELFQHLERVVLGLDSIVPSRVSIFKLWGVFGHRRATVSQDRLYALIGPAGDIGLEEFPPDYSESPAATNIRFAKKMVEKGHGMDILYHATKLSIEPLRELVPSWAPDWTFPRVPGHHPLDLRWAYHGGFDGRLSSKQFVSQVESQPHLLKVSGCRLDGIRGSASIIKFDTLSASRLGHLPTEMCQYFQRIEDLFSGTPYFTGETWHEVQCQTIIAGHGLGDKNSPSSLSQEYLQIKNAFLVPQESRKAALEGNWAGKWLHLMPWHAACKTSQGYVGLVPEIACAADQVFMFFGSDLPFILRPIPNVPNTYRFIGGCYMHGLMKGIAWKHVQVQRSDILLL